MAATNSAAGNGRCPGKCGRMVRADQTCLDCRRRAAWGVLVEAAEDLRLGGYELRSDAQLMAVADLMTLHAVDRRPHLWEVNELAKDAQAAARDGYQQAREDAARDEGGY